MRPYGEERHKHPIPHTISNSSAPTFVQVIVLRNGAVGGHLRNDRAHAPGRDAFSSGDRQTRGYQQAQRFKADSGKDHQSL